MNEFIRIYICVGIVSIHNSSWSLADNKISNIYRMCSQFTCERQLCVCIDNNIHFERKIARSGPAAINSIYSLLFDGATNILVNDNNVFSHRLSAYRVARTSNSTSVFGGFCIFFRFVFWVRKYFFLFTRDSRIFFLTNPIEVCVFRLARKTRLDISSFICCYLLQIHWSAIMSGPIDILLNRVSKKKKAKQNIEGICNLIMFERFIHICRWVIFHLIICIFINHLLIHFYQLMRHWHSLIFMLRFHARK